MSFSIYASTFIILFAVFANGVKIKNGGYCYTYLFQTKNTVPYFDLGIAGFCEWNKVEGHNGTILFCTENGSNCLAVDAVNSNAYLKAKNLDDASQQWKVLADTQRLTNRKTGDDYCAQTTGYWGYISMQLCVNPKQKFELI